MAEKPYDRLDGVIWYDGKLVPWAGATLHVLSHGLHYASCVFEGERAYGGSIFRSTAHSERLKRSAKDGVERFSRGETPPRHQDKRTQRDARHVDRPRRRRANLRKRR